MITINNFKKEIKTKKNELDQKDLKNNKIKQAILTAGTTTNDLKTRKKARSKIKWWMVRKNFYYLAKQVIISLFTLYLFFQPFQFASQYLNTALILPVKSMSYRQSLQIQITANGYYTLAAVTFGIGLWWVLKRPWSKYPFKAHCLDKYIQENYQEIKKELK